MISFHFIYCTKATLSTFTSIKSPYRPSYHFDVPRERALQVIISYLKDAALCSSAPPTQLAPIVQSASSTGNIRASRKDKYLHSTNWLIRVTNLARAFTGTTQVPALPLFSMSFASSNSIPDTPRVISPSPTPSESRESSKDGYFGPVTRSAKKKAASSPTPIDEEIDEETDSSVERRARSRSRSPLRNRRIVGLTSAKPSIAPRTPKTVPVKVAENGHQETNGHLSPTSASSGWSWRDFSRSPSPLGLIPIHRQWRSFVHRHEVPRKVLHVSIGFFTLWFYVSGLQTDAITPYLMAALIPIASTDFLRHTYPSLNRFYVRVLGAFMRETEYDGWNGVIWYLLGAWIVLWSFPKDVAVMGVLLLSWCDTAASTVGRAYGRYTPRIRRGKSLAGSLGAFAVGVTTAALFWGWLSPRTGPFPGDNEWPFMFTGNLYLPDPIRNLAGLTESQGRIGGGLALGIMSLWTGFVASASEVVDIFGWDDNLTIPVLSGLGMWGFLKTFG